MEDKIIVMSVGGSVIVPDNVHHKFLKELKDIIAKDKRKFVIVTGGGKTARDYINALRAEGIKSFLKQNRVGIESTRLNAVLLAEFFEKYNLDVPRSINEVKRLLKHHKVVITGGFRPGSTSDGTAASIAEAVGSKQFINVTNIEGLYTSDPRKSKNARLVPDITYEKFNKFFKKIEEKPGQHFVLDRQAARIVQKNNITVVILKGIRNLRQCLLNRRFVGTVVHG
ncbi:UMP kinase [Candidatus Woesearchaeota archaeon]|nr:UMP kinase [Candidatus Woesearchaeota archaeon]